MYAVLVLCVTWLNRARLSRQSYECSAGFDCDLAEQSWAFKAVMYAVLGLTVTWLNRAGLSRQSCVCSAGTVCDSAEQSWALKAEL